MNTSRNTYFNFKHQPNEHKECQRTSSRIQVCERQEAQFFLKQVWGNR